MTAAFKQRIGLVPQDIALYEDLAAGRNLELFGALYGLSGATLASRVSDALTLVGLTDRAKDKPSTFSGGMKRRLNIACALVHDPDVLLFDEPTVGVDPQSRNAIFDNLEALRARGKALLYTTHYMEEAERLCDRIVVMDHGRVVADDTLPGLLARLPHAEVLQLDVGQAVDCEGLTALAGVVDAHETQGVIHVRLKNMDSEAARVLDWCHQKSLVVRRINSARANLEDVFLALTGSQLRDHA
jgi:ABC-2 type transport system ATP-binding protein